jgi:carboxyl-terminal processing protease
MEDLTVQRNRLALLAGLLVVLAAVLGLRAGMNVWAAGSNDDIYSGVKLMNDVTDLVRKYYVTDVDNKKLYEHAIEGLLQGQDRFSSFIAPEELAEFNKQVKGSFGGIGVLIGEEAGWLTAISPVEDGPAYRAGVLAGDRIIEIEGKTTEGLATDEAVKRLTGPPGTRVTFTVLHLHDLSKETFTVTREVIHVKTVKGLERDADGKWKYIIDKDAGIAYIRLTSFTENSVDDLKKALEEARAQGMKNLIFDLRFNGGGLLPAAVGVCSLFLDGGRVVSTKGRADPEEVFEAGHNAIPYCPMVVLVNNSSASASEIVAGALQDRSRAVVVGERTYGKGSVQRIFPVDDGKAAVKLTVAHYYLPSGRCLHREEDSKVWGVDPLVVVKMTPQEYADVFIGWRNADVLHTNGKNKDNATARPASPQGENAPKSNEKAGGPDAGSPPLAQTAEKKTDQAKKPAEDRQLSRAVDVLRMMPVLAHFIGAGAAPIVAGKNVPAEKAPIESK